MAQKRVVTLAIPPATTMTPPPRLSAITSISVPDLVSSLKRSAAGEHPCEQQRGGGGGRGREEAPVEYAVLMIGSEQKRPLYDKILGAACKTEKHVQYADVTYLTIHPSSAAEATTDSTKKIPPPAPCVLELTEKEMEHTGAREMEIRRADAVILCYSVYEPESFHQLNGVLEDFLSRKNFPYVLLLANEDQPAICDDALDEKQQHNDEKNLLLRDESADLEDRESTSEGYGSSDSPDAWSDGRPGTPPKTSTESTVDADGKVHRQHRRPRRLTMRQICRLNEDGMITKEQGEMMSRLFGPDCEFISTSFANFDGTQAMVDKMIVKIRELAVQTSQAPQKRRSEPRAIFTGPAISLKRLIMPLPKMVEKRRASADLGLTTSDGGVGPLAAITAAEKGGGGGGGLLSHAFEAIGRRIRPARESNKKPVASSTPTTPSVPTCDTVAPAVETTTGEQGQQQPFGPLFSPTKKNGGIKAAWANDEDDTTTKMTMADNTEKKLSIGGGGGTSGAEARRPSSASLTGDNNMAPPKGADLKQNEREECEQGVREEGATNGGGGPQQLLEEPPPTAAGGLLTRSRAGSQRLLQRMSTGVFNHHPGSFFRRRPTEAETGKKNGVVLAPGEDAIGKPEKKDKAATKSTACAIM